MRQLLVAWAVLAMAGLAAAVPVRPPGTAQVPLDSAGRVWALGPRLERSLHLFDSVDSFVAARVYQRRDSSYLLVVTVRDEDEYVKRQRSLDPEEFLRLRSAVTEHLRATNSRYRLDQSGREKLLLGTTLLGVGFYSWAIPGMVARDRADGTQRAPSAVAVSVLATSLPIILTQNVPVPEGAARLGVWGGTRGIAFGYLYYEAYERPYEPRYSNHWDCTPDVSDRDRHEIRAPFLGSVGGLATGLATGYVLHTRPGTAAAVGICGDAGLVGGGLVGLLRDDEYILRLHRPERAKAALWGGVAGIGLGAALSHVQSYSVGDALVLRSTTALGVAVPWAVARLAGWDKRTSVSLVLGGLAAGLGAGHYLTRDVDFPAFEGGLLEVSLVVGGSAAALASGIIGPVIVRGWSERPEHRIAAITTGAVAGFALGYHHLRHAELFEERTTHWQFDVAPQPDGALAMLGISF